MDPADILNELVIKVLDAETKMTNIVLMACDRNSVSLSDVNTIRDIADEFKNLSQTLRAGSDAMERELSNEYN